MHVDSIQKEVDQSPDVIEVTTAVKDAAMSPTATASGSESDHPELLGSLTTQQQQRTSARVIKKLKLEPPSDKRVKRPEGQVDELTECDTPNKIDDKDLLKFPTVKQRMPKALWSTDEKSLFFEALNEYGKDFDAITAHICAKMKKKGMPDVNLKTKTQVSHFYYRTWHKLSKHVHFNENVKKVAQELYALINYGELRKKLASVSEKTCARLGDMVRDERAYGARVCSRAGVTLRARDACAWARVQAAAHNPRAHVSLPLQQRQPKKLALHLGPKPNAEIHIPVLSPSEQLSSQKICFSSYLERMCSQRRDKDGGYKDKEIEPKKFKEDNEPIKLMNFDETAIDGIELMANYKNILEDEEKPSTEDEKDMKAEETADEELLENITERDKDVFEKEISEKEKDISERDKDISEKEKDMSEKEKDSFSEMEDDEKYNKSDTDNESDQGKNEQNGKQTKFKNLKVKFRIRPKKRGGSIYTLILDKDGGGPEEVKTDDQKTEDQKSEEEPKPDIDVDMAMRQIRKGWKLDYWWAEPTSPLPQPIQPTPKPRQEPEKEKLIEKKEKADKTLDKSIDGPIEDSERTRESDTDIFSPKNAYGQDSNDGMSGDERKYLIPVKIVPNSSPPLPKILPKPPPTAPSDLSFLYVLSESNGQFYFHDGDRRIPITSQEQTDFLPTESMSLSPSRLLRDTEGWFEGSVQDFSLSSFLGHLEGRPQQDLVVDTQLQSLMAESSVDYVAKFADLAAEVTDEGNNLNEELN
ncbi:unnamed protein product [Diatraea saccharalis]|uniref:SANT domain-containing protein n=1 Tax=Diatraea saccharalis TaxID=40085 RepID=A0A9N9N038_9NEOP|nr:unnamed protein product [Diatraea saccharalis]